MSFLKAIGLGNILENETVKNALFKQLRNLLIESKLEYIILTLDENQDIVIKLCQPGDATITYNLKIEQPDGNIENS